MVTFTQSLKISKFLICTGSAVGFKLDSLLKLTDTRASNSKMTLMHYLCKVWFTAFLFLPFSSQINFIL